MRRLYRRLMTGFGRGHGRLRTEPKLLFPFIKCRFDLVFKMYTNWNFLLNKAKQKWADSRFGDIRIPFKVHENRHLTQNNLRHSDDWVQIHVERDTEQLANSRHLRTTLNFDKAMSLPHPLMHRHVTTFCPIRLSKLSWAFMNSIYWLASWKMYMSLQTAKLNVKNHKLPRTGLNKIQLTNWNKTNHNNDQGIF